jgi:hypothetical protein
MADQPQQIIVEESPWEDKFDSIVDSIVDGDEPVDEEISDDPEIDAASEAEPAEDPAVDEPEYVEIKHNGKPVKMSLDEVLEHASKGFDYTQKTQELAAQRRQLEEFAQLVHQNSQLQEQTIQETAQLYAIDGQLQNYRQVNWDAWIDQDPIEAQKGWQKFQMLEKQRDHLAGAIHQKRTEIQHRSAAQLQRQLEESSQALAREIKGWGPELVNSLRSNAMEYGFDEREINAIFDPRYVKVLHDAYQWRKLQSGKPEVQKRVTAAPSSVKPTGKVDDPAANRKTLMKQLRATKDVRKRERIASSLLDKFV